MILSFAPLTPYTLALWTACSVAALAYGAAALFPVAPAPQTRAVRLVLLLAWGAQALALLVDIAGIGHSAPGARLVATCAPGVAAAAAPLARLLAAQIGARFAIAPDPAAPRERLDVGPA